MEMESEGKWRVRGNGEGGQMESEGKWRVRENGEDKSKGNQRV